MLRLRRAGRGVRARYARAVDAREWLTSLEYTHIEGDRWTGPGLEPDGETANGVAHAISDALWYSDLPLDEAVDLTFALLKVVPSYALLMYLRMDWDRLPEPLRDSVLTRYALLLEAEDPALTDAVEAVEYSIWVDFFEDLETQEQTLRALTADLVAEAGAATPAAARRLERVLPLTGPVLWEHKRPLYEALSGDPRWAPSVLRGLVASYHDIYGHLVPDEALGLLDRLAVPAAAEDLSTLRTVLQRGAANHYHQPEAWGAAASESST